MPLDVDDLLGVLDDPATEPFDGLPTGTVMGHVHLKVADIPSAVDFYRDVLGFDLMAQLGTQAAFLSAGRLPPPRRREHMGERRRRPRAGRNRRPPARDGRAARRRGPEGRRRADRVGRAPPARTKTATRSSAIRPGMRSSWRSLGFATCSCAWKAT